MTLYWIGRFLCNVLIHILFDVRFEGLENIPRDKGYILACNHRSNFDPLFLAQGPKQYLRFMAKVELFQKNAFVGWLLKNLGAFPVARGQSDNGAMDYATQIVAEGGVLAIFPEGHRSKDGVPLRARSGVGMVAAQTGADVLPAAVIFGKELKFRARVTMRYGTLIPHEELGLDASSPSSIRKASKRIMDNIVELTGYKPENSARES